MEEISSITNGIFLKLGTPNALYIDSLVKVEYMGLFGVLKGVTIFTPSGVLKDITDPMTPAFPEQHRYILKIEDYYTKKNFLVDTEKYICTNPLFCLVKDCMAVPYEFVMLIADTTTTRQDILRASELTRNTFMVYYRKGVEIDAVLKREAPVPSINLDSKLEMFCDSIQMMCTD
jgi:hypothetical protein